MKIPAILVLALLPLPLHAADIASCSNPSGKAYFPETGSVTGKDSGWHDDKITGGLTKLSKLEDGTYDIFFVDARNDIFSARQSGAHVMLLSGGANSVSVLVVYPGTTAEVYTFLRTNSGSMEYIHTTSRAGDQVSVTKASVMRGDCEYINLEAM